MTPRDCLNLVSLVEAERASCSENSSDSTKKFAREERESGAVESGTSLALVVVVVVAVAVVVVAVAAVGGAAVVVVAAVVAEAE